jgi:hypothetical protein
VAEGKVVTLGVRGMLSCLDAADGKVVWRKNDIRGWPQFFTVDVAPGHQRPLHRATGCERQTA